MCLLIICSLFLFSPSASPNCLCPRPETEGAHIWNRCMEINNYTIEKKCIILTEPMFCLRFMCLPKLPHSVPSSHGKLRGGPDTHMGEDWWPLATFSPRVSLRWFQYPSIWIILWSTSLNFCLCTCHILLMPLPCVILDGNKHFKHLLAFENCTVF